MKTRKDALYSTQSKVLDIFTDSATGGRKAGNCVVQEAGQAKNIRLLINHICEPIKHTKAALMCFLVEFHMGFHQPRPSLIKVRGSSRCY